MSRVIVPKGQGPRCRWLARNAENPPQGISLRAHVALASMRRRITPSNLWTCSKCKTGRHSRKGKTRCLPCAYGKYNDAQGSSPVNLAMTATML